MYTAASHARLYVVRYDGNLDEVVSVAYKTSDGTAVAGLDFEATEVGKAFKHCLCHWPCSGAQHVTSWKLQFLQCTMHCHSKNNVVSIG